MSVEEQRSLIATALDAKAAHLAAIRMHAVVMARRARRLRNA